ncbi:MAG: rod shape-determining protein MreC [Candidatus Magasanikbacteria bacterium CG_4_10_14_0_2_um_filter_33_14]|uniref:Cell shape-determining protein MreC n=1 Tax=Candidatus Magasanikbacteria bacterium CG_4_10_14_0_2_um_filter_33_14 TaxID=1974636 RepID=A0A2M7V9Z0_9BACT|nr:MAG: rod shape-determining protein MreC [Candidatus Magasanikbacteria bacterium CG_4_10_14_0_2_um_filter_33_14]
MVKKTKTATFVTIFVVVIFVLGLRYLHWINFIEKPVVAIVDWSLKPINNVKSFFIKREKNFTIDELNTIEDSKKENEVLKTQVQLLSEDNEELKKQLNFFVNKNFQHIGAKVLSRTVNPLGTTIVIDKGSKENIMIDNPVVVNEGILIGKIIKVEENRSVVRLINDNSSAIGATVLNIDRSIGLVEGGYGLGVRMNYIPQNEIVTPGDTVITSGLTEGLPKGLVIGKIELVDKQPHEPFQQAVITPATDLTYINFVSIIIGS